MNKEDENILNRILVKQTYLLVNLDDRLKFIEEKFGLINETNYSTVSQSRKRNRPKAKKQRRKV